MGCAFVRAIGRTSSAPSRDRTARPSPFLAFLTLLRPEWLRLPPPKRDTLTTADSDPGGAAASDPVIVELDEAMGALIALIEAEIRLVRAKKLAEAARLRPDKARLVRRYMAAVDALRKAGPILMRDAPERLERLRRRHDAFCVNLQAGAAILTAHRAQEVAVARTRPSSLTKTARWPVRGQR